MNFLPILLLLLISTFTLSMATYNVINFGAKPDGRTDSAKAFLATWAKTCGSSKAASMTVPSGRFLISQALFQGPCNNNAIRIFIQGSLVAPSGYSQASNWITFKYVKGVSIFGGTLDGQGQALWSCKTAGRSCPNGATALTIGQSSNILISGMTLINSEMFHVMVFASNFVTFQGVNIIAPENSPNTDGIHMQKSSYVTIRGSTMKTGDDCISMGEGSTNIWIEKINCGPGHGISIGSLGGTQNEDPVQNVTVKSAVFTGTQNGLRVKTWANLFRGSVTGVTFQNAFMKNVENPIVIDQNYCPSQRNCPTQGSGIQISKVTFSDVQGTSATPIAVKLDCSPRNPCRGMALRNIKLTYGGKPAQSFCRNALGKSSGFVIPPSCL